MTGNDQVAFVEFLQTFHNLWGSVHADEGANACVSASHVFFQRRCAYAVHFNVDFACKAVFVANPNFRLLTFESFFVFTDAHQFVDNVLNGAAWVAFHESVHFLLSVAFCQNISRSVECYVGDVQQFCHVAHLSAVAGVHCMVAFGGVRVSQTLCFIDRNTAFHQFLHMVTAKEVAGVCVDDAVWMMLCHTVEAQLFCQQQHGGIHIDTCQNFFHVFFVIVNDTGVFRHEFQTNEVHYDLIHFFYCHVASSCVLHDLLLL